MTRPTTGQILRAVRTLTTRNTQIGNPQFCWYATRGQRARGLAGARRAKTRTLRLMAEYLGVGEPAPYRFGTIDMWVHRRGNTFHLEMQKDRTMP